VLASIFVAAAVWSAQDTKSDRSALRSDLEPALSFEASPSGDMPGGWTGGPAGAIFADTKVVHGGKGSARIERNAASANGELVFAHFGQHLSHDMAKRVPADVTDP
jgi:hypothetical protein